MKILFALPRQHPNQAGWYKALSEHGHEVTYIVAYSLPENERQNLPEPYVTPSVAAPRWYKALLTLRKFIAKEALQKPYLLWPDKNQLETLIIDFDPDIVIIREALTPLALVTQSIVKKRGIPSAHYSQAPITKADGMLFMLLRKLRIVPKRRMTTTLSDDNPKNWAPNCSYVPLFVPTYIDKISSTSSDQLRLLFVGKFNSRRKNHLLLLEVLASLPSDLSFHLTMVGSTVFPDQAYHQEVLHRIEKLNLTDKVTTRYDVSPLEMRDIYIQHDVFVLPSVDEPFAISPLEAMAHGLPAIVTNSNGCQFHIKDGINGYVVKSNDLETLKTALIHLSTRETLDKLKRGALNYSRYENNDEKFLNCFTEMISDIKK